MKILVITDLYPVMEDERYTPKTIKRFVEGWQSLGHEIKIIKPNFMLNSFLRKKPFYKTGLYGNLENINYFLPFCGKVKDKIKTKIDADVIFAHMPSGLIFANKLGLPFVAGVHVSDLEVLTNPIYSLYFKPELEKAYKNSLKIACRSEVIKNKFIALYPEFAEKTFVAYSGIDEKKIVKRVWKNKRKILTCAHLIKRKNVDKVIKACEKIECELTVIGNGKELKNLKKLSEKTNFLGYLPHNKVLEVMQDSDIFVLPSQNETFGMVYLEAMASGCVTVGLRNDGLDGIIKDGVNGYLVSIDNIEETLDKIMQNDQSKILENSYETILNYTNKNACENYLNNVL